ncbi:hypothetical protein UA45_22030, partial [Morganella morganii]
RRRTAVSRQCPRHRCGTATAIGRIGGILGPLLAGYLIQYQFAVSTIFLIFSAAVVIAILAVIFLGAETRNRELSYHLNPILTAVIPRQSLMQRIVIAVIPPFYRNRRV